CSFLQGLESQRAQGQAFVGVMTKVSRKSQNEKYRLKYSRLRRAAKAMVFENAALCDEIARLEEKFLHVKEERRFLLTKLLQMPSHPSAVGLPGQKA
uniref:INO80 complex subunit E N-terminal domain-containing protein n=1 Tax=Crocodylus porosus TaxID=8502 RepID=A0A7M4F712_CROPO